MYRLVLLSLLLVGCQVETSPRSVEVDTPDSVAAAPDRVRPAARPDASTRPDTSARRVSADSSRGRISPVERASRRTAALTALEDLATRAPDADAQGLGRALALVDERAAALAGPSPALDSLLRAARAAERRGDRARVALAAAHAHRALTNTVAPDAPARLRSDGLVLAALARQPLPDWTSIRAAAADLAARWERLEARAFDAGVHDALAAAVQGARRGADEQNAPLVRLAAEVAVDLSSSLGVSAETTR